MSAFLLVGEPCELNQKKIAQLILAEGAEVMVELVQKRRRADWVFDSQIASVAMFVLAAFGFYFSFRFLPPIWELPPPLGKGREGNWLGQTGPQMIGYGVLLLLTVYSLKWMIVSKCASSSMRIFNYILIVLMSLPYIWFLCSTDWFNPFVYRIGCWIGDPIAIWLVPTASFIADLSRRPTLLDYLIRSSIEIIIILPIWVLFWTVFSFFYLGFGWI